MASERPSRVGTAVMGADQHGPSALGDAVLVSHDGLMTNILIAFRSHDDQRATIAERVTHDVEPTTKAVAS